MSHADTIARLRAALLDFAEAALPVKPPVDLLPQTFGEARMAYPWLACEPHEWDNRTTPENARWIIERLYEQLAASTREAFERDDVMGKRTVTIIEDDPALDGTDGAHPAWWRGQKYGVEATAGLMTQVLDGQHHGQFGFEPLQTLAERLSARSCEDCVCGHCEEWHGRYERSGRFWIGCERCGSDCRAFTKREGRD